MTDIIVSLISGTLVLTIFSFLYKDNPFFEFGQHVLIGGMAGFTTAIGLKRFWDFGIYRVLEGEAVYVIPIILGLLYFTKYMPSKRWVTRIPSAVLVGTGIGLNMRAGVETQVITQIIDTIKPMNNINNIIILIGVCTGLLVFFYSKESTGALGTISKIGQHFLMIAFGGGFAYAVMGRSSILIDRLGELLVYPTYYLIPIAIALVLYDIYRKKN